VTDPGGRAGPRGDGARGALGRAIAYLLELQGADGSWTDLWLTVGASDAWVTGFAGTALAEAQRDRLVPGDLRGAVAQAVERACWWLRAAISRRGGWGYNATVPPDADSTAWGVTLLAVAGHAVPQAALRLLDRHRVAGAGIRTYQRAGHAWGRPLPDVAATGLRAAYEARALSREGLAAAWLADVAPATRADGTWPPYWWSSPVYPTGVALDVWALAGRPGPRRETAPAAAGRASSAFEQAWLAIIALAACDDAGAYWPPLDALLGLQQDDGGWPSGRFLVVPGASPGGARPAPTGDARRLLTTASAVMALTRAARRDIPPGVPGGIRRRAAPGADRHGAAGSFAGQVVFQVARAAGLGEESAAAARIFHELTRETFAEPSPWPSAQLSSLGAGIPLEFSVAGPPAAAGLRYAVEAGHPFLPAPRRATSAVRAIRRTAGRLGYDLAWQRVQDAVGIATDPSLPVPDRCRFWVWGGMDQPLDAAGRPLPPRLKIYLSLVEAADGRTRLDRILRAAGVPLSPEASACYDLLDAAGFPHEAGFGLGPDGQIAVKVYYELLGWRPGLVASLLGLSGLVARAAAGPGHLELLRPEIPGVIGERLAARSRAGIAFRLDPGTGDIRELTSAVAFPPPLAGHSEIGRRILGWTDRGGWRTRYAAISHLLAGERHSGGADHTGDAGCPPGAGPAAPLHSLLTRTVSRDAAWSTIYLRPAFPASGAARSRPRSSTTGR
jgi:Prenyltransferase and squalene oxidase repeat